MTTGRVAAYIDGFNFYYGMMEAGLGKYRWLDYRRLCGSLIGADQTLLDVKYFTARVRNNDSAGARQATYIDALQTTGVIVEEGHFLMTDRKCHHCNEISKVPEEKKTDVNIALQLFCDALDDRFDTAFLYSGDSDLVPCVLEIRARWPDKSIVIASPPKRQSLDLKAAANAELSVGRNKIRNAQLPLEIRVGQTHVLRCPERWS